MTRNPILDLISDDLHGCPTTKGEPMSKVLRTLEANSSCALRVIRKLVDRVPGNGDEPMGEYSGELVKQMADTLDRISWVLESVGYPETEDLIGCCENALDHLKPAISGDDTAIPDVLSAIEELEKVAGLS